MKGGMHAKRAASVYIIVEMLFWKPCQTVESAFLSTVYTLIQLVQTQGTVFLRRSIHFSDAPEFLRCSTKIDPTTVDLSDAVIISQMLHENVLEWLTYLYNSHQLYVLDGMGASSRWSASDKQIEEA